MSLLAYSKVLTCYSVWSANTAKIPIKNNRKITSSMLYNRLFMQFCGNEIAAIDYLQSNFVAIKSNSYVQCLLIDFNVRSQAIDFCNDIGRSQ